MNNPTPKQVQQAVALAEGLLLWQNGGMYYPVKPHAVNLSELVNWEDLPADAEIRYWHGQDWVTSHDAARELEIEDYFKFIVQLGIIVIPRFDPVLAMMLGYDDVEILLKATPLQWCLAWLMSEHGIEWCDCQECSGTGKCDIGHPDCCCPHCSGERGEFREVK